MVNKTHSRRAPQNQRCSNQLDKTRRITHAPQPNKQITSNGDRHTQSEWSRQPSERQLLLPNVGNGGRRFRSGHSRPARRNLCRLLRSRRHRFQLDIHRSEIDAQFAAETQTRTRCSTTQTLPFASHARGTGRGNLLAQHSPSHLGSLDLEGRRSAPLVVRVFVVAPDALHRHASTRAQRTRQDTGTTRMLSVGKETERQRCRSPLPCNTQRSTAPAAARRAARRTE